jgi:hypothetical protein
MLCEWDDIEYLLSDADTRHYRTMNCDERMPIVRNAWWLGQPLWSRPGNHRRSEHDTRRIMQILGRTGVNPTWLRWGNDMEEIVMRFGWPDYWRRYWSTMGEPNPERPQIIQYTLEPSYHFLPRMSAMLLPSQASAGDWDLLPPDSREEYSPDSLVFHELEQQSARFLRGDSLLLHTRASVHNDDVLRWKRSLRASQVFMSSAAELPRVFMSQVDAVAFTLECMVPNVDWVAGVEVLTDDGRAARTRFGSPAITFDARNIAHSDFLLYAAGDTAAGEARLETIGNNVIAVLEFQRDTSVGVFWESYGLRRNDRLDVVVTVQPDDEPGFFHRLGQALRLVQKSGTLTVQWHESESIDRNIAPRAIRLSLASLRPGSYSLRLSVRVNGAEPHESTRRIRILP